MRKWKKQYLYFGVKVFLFLAPSPIQAISFLIEGLRVNANREHLVSNHCDA